MTASGGTLDLLGTVNSGLVLAIATGSPSTLKIDGTATSAAAITLNNANQTLEIGASASLTINAAQTATNGTIKIDGGTLTDASGITLTSPAALTGLGTIAANTALSGTGTVTASGGTLDLLGTVNSGLVLAIGTTAGSLLKIDGTAVSASAITLNNANQKLEIGAAGSLTINAAETITNATVQLDGGTLNAAGGLTNTSGTIIGSGTLTGALSGAGTIEASGGTLDITGNITASGVTGLKINNDSPTTTLRLDGTVASGNTITFLGSTGVLALTNFSNADTSNAALLGFSGTVAGLSVSSTTSAPSGNYIDLTHLDDSNIASAVLNTTTDVLTVTNVSGTSFTLQLTGSYAAGTQVGWTGDGGSGSELFLAPALASNTFTVANTNGASYRSDSWSHAASWSGGAPGTDAGPEHHLGVHRDREREQPQ